MTFYHGLLTRFFVQYDILGEKKLPLDYRSTFMHLVKTSLDSTIGHEIGMFQKTPLCLAIRFDKRPEITNSMIKIGNTLKVYISSPDHVLATNIYNGLLKVKEYTIFDCAISKPRFVYLNEYKFYQRQVKMFYTFSPIVIRNHKDKTKYVTPTDIEFMDSFANALTEQWAMYRDGDIGRFTLNIIKYKKVAMTHYGGLVLGFTGLFTLEADSDVLEFFYKAGIGYRRSNGFGFIEVDK